MGNLETIETSGILKKWKETPSSWHIWRKGETSGELRLKKELENSVEIS